MSTLVSQTFVALSIVMELIACSGANPSAEEAEEALAEGAEQKNNVVHSFRLQATQFDKKVSRRGLYPAPSLGQPWRMACTSHCPLPHPTRQAELILIPDLPHLLERLHEVRQDQTPGDQP